MWLVNQVFCSRQELHDEQCPNSECKIVKPRFFVVKFHEISPKPQAVSQKHHPKILEQMVGQIFLQKFSKPYSSSYLQKSPSQCLPFPNPLRPIYLKFGPKLLYDYSTQCQLTLTFYLGPCRVSKHDLGNQCTVQEHCSQHLSLNLVGQFNMLAHESALGNFCV